MEIENACLTSIRNELLVHPLYKEIKSPEQLRCFMEHHVFAVWDFMSLLKALQERLTKTASPWYPVGDPEVRYLINEIVVAEETDLNFYGKRQSHFEMYLDNMKKSGAETGKILDFLEQAKHGTDIFLVIATSDLPESIKQFLKLTFGIISEGKSHKIAAAFTYGREGLIPQMFSAIIENIQRNYLEVDLELFKYYFDRHIELDADEHGPMAFKMVEDLCGNDLEKWKEVEETAKTCLESRLLLWNGIRDEIKRNKFLTTNS